MVFVRKSELACRNDWDQDLWEPIEAGAPDEETAEDVPVPIGQRSAAARDERQQTDTLAAIDIAPRKANRQSPLGPTTPTQRPNSPPVAEPSPRPLLTSARAAADDVRPRDTSEPAERPLGEWTTQRATPATDPGVGWSRSNRLGPSQVRPPAVRTDRAAPRPGLPRIEDLPPAPPHQPRTRPAPAPAAAPLPIESDDDWAAPPRHHRPGMAPDAPAPRPQVQSGSTERFELPDAGLPPREPRSAPPPAPEPDQPEPPMPPIRVMVEGKALPQRCGTCRDFRPAEGGERGWCNNRYAFEHPRMVQADELACASTIGNWWIPTDAWWQQRASIEHHGRPTPEVDEYLRRLLEERVANRRAAR